MCHIHVVLQKHTFRISIAQGKTKGKGIFLYSAVSSPLDRSKRFTLFASRRRPVHSDTNSASPGSILARQQLRATAKPLTFPPLSIARYSFIQLSEQGRQWRERKYQIFGTVTKRDSNPGSLDCESGILPLSSTQVVLFDLIRKSSCHLPLFHFSHARFILVNFFAIDATFTTVPRTCSVVISSFFVTRHIYTRVSSCHPLQSRLLALRCCPCLCTVHRCRPCHRSVYIALIFTFIIPSSILYSIWT